MPLPRPGRPASPASLLSLTALALLALLAGACRREAQGEAERAAPSAAPLPARLPAPSPGEARGSPSEGPGPEPPRPAGLPGLSAESWLVKVEGAVVSVPLGAKGPRPLMIGVHGALDRAEWACGGWRGVTEAFPFIVCPLGATTSGDRYTLGPVPALKQQIDRAIDEVRARFGPYVAEGPAVYAGFSLGAIRGAPLLQDEAERFPRALLCEGGLEQLGGPFAKAYAQPGRRVLLVCSQPGCERAYEAAASRLRAAGVEARALYAGPFGHNLNGEVVASLKERWWWLVEGDDRWAGAEQAARAAQVPRAAGMR